MTDQGIQIMADKEKMRRLIEDCQRDIAEYPPTESGISKH
ncbi:hypothetical protein USDA257_c39710 [Sinorhizobium fredii USDA 257]|uniref:Uncharacterized protein n=1 Tax=Sinorhizobium fredii (strain USDA 257) TaxID=1185652 RepID=I3X9F9_SINF2|nr:hypothetical protein USDA257_c39710 [Sinorhizobium fredii USDA 257]